MIDAYTRCNVCEMSPAETLYRDEPMCYDCRAATAKAEREEKESARALLLDEYERYCLNRVAPLSDD